MPIIISKAGAVQYVKDEETLAEVLGHTDFDGADCAIGDRLVFENGTQSHIKQEPGELFHTWDEPMPVDFDEVKRAVGATTAGSWKELFDGFDNRQASRSGCLAAVIVVLLLFVFISVH
jgi:hypothetical protein